MRNFSKGRHIHCPFFFPASKIIGATMPSLVDHNLPTWGVALRENQRIHSPDFYLYYSPPKLLLDIPTVMAPIITFVTFNMAPIPWHWMQISVFILFWRWESKIWPHLQSLDGKEYVSPQGSKALQFCFDVSGRLIYIIMCLKYWNSSELILLHICFTISFREPKVNPI